MTNPEPKKQNSDPREKVQELRPAQREKISQGQAFDEMQKQEKNPDGKQQK